LAIRPFPAAARGRTRCPKTDCTASSLGSCTPTPATPAFAAGPTESRSQERNTSRTNTSVSAALGLIGYAKRIDDPVSSTTAAELATARLARDDLESVLRLIWPSMAELHAGIHLSQRRQAARDDAVFNELIARLDEEDDDCDG
jgi:hypothetical protein